MAAPRREQPAGAAALPLLRRATSPTSRPVRRLLKLGFLCLGVAVAYGLNALKAITARRRAQAQAVLIAIMAIMETSRRVLCRTPRCAAAQSDPCLLDATRRQRARRRLGGPRHSDSEGAVQLVRRDDPRLANRRRQSLARQSAPALPRLALRDRPDQRPLPARETRHHRAHQPRGGGRGVARRRPHPLGDRPRGSPQARPAGASTTRYAASSAAPPTTPARV